MEDPLRRSALEYHRRPPPGKISVTPTKGLVNQRDLALAYTPGVAAACEEIVRDPAEARNMTSRGNLIGVVTNGTAVLGLGAIGPLAAKPVMEGKAVLFKKFAGIDCFDIELNGLRVGGKERAGVKLVCSGAGAAALACLDLLVSLGLKADNVWVSDIKGVVYEGRKEEMDP